MGNSNGKSQIEEKNPRITSENTTQRGKITSENTTKRGNRKNEDEYQKNQEKIGIEGISQAETKLEQSYASSSYLSTDQEHINIQNQKEPIKDIAKQLTSIPNLE